MIPSLPIVGFVLLEQVEMSLMMNAATGMTAAGPEQSATTESAATESPCKNFQEANQKWAGYAVSTHPATAIVDTGAVPMAGADMQHQRSNKVVRFFAQTEAWDTAGTMSTQPLLLTASDSGSTSRESSRRERLILSFEAIKSVAGQPVAFAQQVQTNVITRLQKAQDIDLYRSLLDNHRDAFTDDEQKTIITALEQQTHQLASAQEQRQEERKKSTEERLEHLWQKLEQQDLTRQPSSSEESYSMPSTPSPSSSLGNSY